MINIDGVEVLDSYPIYSIPTWATITMIVLVVVTTVWLILVVENYWRKWADVILIALLLICFAFFICGITGVFNYDTGKNTYKCTIEDNVPLNEIYESYDIISKDGKIWTLNDLED